MTLAAKARKPENALLSIPEAALMLNVSVATIRNWVWLRRVPSVRIGRSVRLRQSDLQKVIDAGLIPADERMAVA